MFKDCRGSHQKEIGEQNKAKVDAWLADPNNKGRSRRAACLELNISYSTLRKHSKEQATEKHSTEE